MPEVHSSNVKHLSYEGDTLTVTFHSGRKYQFSGVKKQLYETLLASPSKGKFLSRFISRYKKGKEITDDTST